MELCLIGLVVVVLIHSNHNLNQRILRLLLCVDIACILAARHQFVNDTLVLLAVRIIDDMVDNLTVAQYA